MKKLIEVITTPYESIFYALQNLENADIPWIEDNINVELDIDYLFNRSGNKIISTLADFFVDSETGKIDDLSMITLAKVIYTKYGSKWNKEYATFSLEYDPISNYDMTERMTNDQTSKQYGHTNTRTDNLAHSETDNLTRTDNLAHSETDNLTRTDNLNEVIENKKAGFNSSEYNDVDKSIKDNTGTQTNNHSISGSNTGTQTNNHSINGTNTGTQANVESGTDTETRNYLLTRKGNVGVTTSQQMIESERKLWLWNFFDEIVYPDIDRVLTINMYE